ncbi:MAG: ABC transporter ATP-binding protein, partial [Bacillota bacterium]
LPLILKGIPRKQARDEVKRRLNTFGLTGFEDYYPRQLSGGMRQRAALLRTYLFSSQVLLLDEPFASLDALTRRRMQSWLIEVFNQLKSTILFVTHDVDEALYLCDRIYVLSDCPTVVKLAVDVPFCRPGSGRTLTIPEYAAVRDTLLEALSV